MQLDALEEAGALEWLGHCQQELAYEVLEQNALEHPVLAAAEQVEVVAMARSVVFAVVGFLGDQGPAVANGSRPHMWFQHPACDCRGPERLTMEFFATKTLSWPLPTKWLRSSRLFAAVHTPPLVGVLPQAFAVAAAGHHLARPHLLVDPT